MTMASACSFRTHFFGLRFPREQLSEGRLRQAKGLSQDDLAYEAEVMFRGMAHRADIVSNREPLQVGKTIGAAYMICNASPRRAASYSPPLSLSTS
jgi:hypothetical protein